MRKKRFCAFLNWGYIESNLIIKVTNTQTKKPDKSQASQRHFIKMMG